jgi:hypothetical protein
MTSGLAWLATEAVAEAGVMGLLDMTGHPNTKGARTARVRQCAILWRWVPSFMEAMRWA